MKKSFFKNYFGIIIACLITFSFFLPKLIQGKVPIPADVILGLYHPWRDLAFDGFNIGKFPTKNPLITDPVLQTYPWRLLTINNIKQQNLPLWNPYSFSGQPLLANIQSAPFSIFNILFLVLPFKIAWSLQIILPFILTSLFMFLFLKNLNLSIPASIFGASILPFSGFFIAWFTWGTIITTALWLPLILLSINKLYYRISIFWFIVLILAFSQTVFSGHWQTAFYVFFASVIFLIFKFYQSKKIKNTALVLASLIIGILICFVQILPAIEFIKFSAREIDQGYFPNRADWFLPLQNLIQLVAPDYFGNPATYNYWGIWNYAEFVSYIGIAPLVLALLGIFYKSKNIKFVLILFASSLILALSNPISKIPYLMQWPFLSSLQPSRIIFLLSFSLVILSAYGMDFLLNTKKNKKLFLAIIVILISIIILISYTIFLKSNFSIINNIDTAKVAQKNLILPAVVALVVFLIFILNYLNIPKIVIILTFFLITIFELFRFGYKFTSFSKLSWIFPKTNITDYLKNQNRPFRILATDRRIFNGNTSGVYRIETVGGYDPLYLADYAKLVSTWQSQKVTQPGSFNRIVTPQNYSSKFINLLNVEYIITFDELTESSFRKVFQEGETKIFKNKNVLPRVFFTNEVVQLQSRNQELEMLLDKDFDIKKSATSTEFNFLIKDLIARADIIDYNDQSFKIITTSNETAPLIISNVYYPGWQALIDNNKADIQRVNFMLQGIIVPKGKHEVEIFFKPRSFYNGLYISVFAVMTTGLITFILWRRKYQ